MKKNKIVFLDFDGVLFNSVKEAYLLSRYAYKSIPATESINEEEYNKFLTLRYLITKSWHFYYLWQIIENKINKEDFYKCLKTGKNIVCEEFDSKYVSYRKNLVKNNYDFWVQLDEPYDFFYEIKKLITTSNKKFVILSNKEKQPIENRLKQYNVTGLKIYANSDLKNYKNKAEFIQDYMKKECVEKAWFVDDSITNFDNCKNINNLVLLHAGWGYTLEKDLPDYEVIKELEND